MNPSALVSRLAPLAVVLSGGGDIVGILIVVLIVLAIIYLIRRT